MRIHAGTRTRSLKGLGVSMSRDRSVRALPLAPRPLATTHPYDPSYQVPVCLDDPLWHVEAGTRDVSAEIMSLCTQLDSVLLLPSRAEESHSSDELGRKVTFQQNLPSRVAIILQQMTEVLRKGGLDVDVEHHLRETGLGYLFPRVELYLQEPDQDLARVSTHTMDAYFNHLSQLNNVLTLAQQLSTDVQSCASHKYIAHQTALLYQCVAHVPNFALLKKEIEGQFGAIKSGCSMESGHIPRLSPDLQKWLVGVCQQLITEVVSLHPAQLPLLHDVLRTLHHLT